MSVDEPTSAEWVIGEWVTLDRELHPFEALELATVIEAVKLHVLHGWPRWWAWTVREPGRADRHRHLGNSGRPRAELMLGSSWWAIHGIEDIGPFKKGLSTVEAGGTYWFRRNGELGLEPALRADALNWLPWPPSGHGRVRRDPRLQRL